MTSTGRCKLHNDISAVFSAYISPNEGQYHDCGPTVYVPDTITTANYAAVRQQLRVKRRFIVYRASVVWGE